MDFLWCKRGEINISNFTRHNVLKGKAYTKRTTQEHRNTWTDGPSRSEAEASMTQCKAGSLVTHRQGKIRTISLGLYPSIQTAQLSKSDSVSCNRESTDELTFVALALVTHTQPICQRSVCLEPGFSCVRANFLNDLLYIGLVSIPSNLHFLCKLSP